MRTRLRMKTIRSPAAAPAAIPLSIAMGYSCGSMNGNIDAILAEADRLMYANKAAVKEQEAAMGVVSLR